MIPIASPRLGDEEISAAAEVMRSGMLAQGKITAAFEKDFASFCGASEGVAVNSGTAALHTALAGLGIGPGDEVIVPDFTFIATATTVSMCGAKPVMADVDPDYYTIDTKSLSSLVTDRTKAVIGVHLYGQPFDVDAVSEICDEHDLFLVEDCAQAHGATWHGRSVGSFGDAGCFSFYPTKNMTTGEGGMVTTSDSALATRMREFMNHGQSRKYLHTGPGYNYRMTDIAASIGRVQLGKLPLMNRRRQENASCLSRLIDVEGIRTPVVRENCGHVFHQYVLRLENMNREDLMAYLKEHEIGSAVHYPIPLHKQPVFSDQESLCPVSEKLSATVLSLPVHPGVSEADCRYIAETINEVA